MATKTNFKTIIFNQHLGDDSDDLPTFSGMSFVGDQTTLVNFNIENTPIEKGYLLLHLWDLEEQSESIELNGVNVFEGKHTGHQLGSHKASIFLLPIEESILKQGNNTLQIKRDSSKGDNFHIYTVVVNWKEEYRRGLFARIFKLKQ
jgi:hypothetical protein